MADAQIFEDLQTKIDDDAQVREQIKAIVSTLERQERVVQAALSRAHSTPSAELQPILEAAQKAIGDEIESIAELQNVSSDFPYYKYNGMWARDVQNVIFGILFCGWLGGMGAVQGKLFTIEEMGVMMRVPVNLKDRDAFHITIEEYLQALISLIEELARLAINSVTLGDYHRPLQISRFIKDIFAGFQILNLKNDALRRRSDGIKYSVKKVEDVVYDLSLRNLLPKAGGEDSRMKVEVADDVEVKVEKWDSSVASSAAAARDVKSETPAKKIKTEE